MYKINFYFLLLLSGILISPYTKAQQNSEVKAIQHFNSGNFNESEKIFQALLEQNPTNPMFNYYYGASRTENGHFSDKELDCLTTAGKQFTPERLYYYLGIQHHSRENWDQALKYYNQFKLSVPEKEQNELDLNRKIQLCFNQSNPFDTAVNPSGVKEADTIDIQNNVNSLHYDTPPLRASAESLPEIDINDDIYTDDADHHVKNSLTDLPGEEGTKQTEEIVHFQVNDFITYFYTTHFQTTEGQKLFKKGIMLQTQQDAKLKEADHLRDEYKKSQNKEKKESIAHRIMKLEYESFQLEEEINKAFSESREMEDAFWVKAGPITRNNFLAEQRKIRESMEEEKHDSYKEEEILVIEYEEPKPITPVKAPPMDLVYKIQIGAYSKGVPAYKQRLFKKLSVIRTIDSYTDENGVVVYTTGKLSRLEDARKMQNQVRQEGIEDAIVVPYINGKRITLEQAKQIEANNDI